MIGSFECGFLSQDVGERKFRNHTVFWNVTSSARTIQSMGRLTISGWFILKPCAHSMFYTKQYFLEYLKCRAFSMISPGTRVPSKEQHETTSQMLWKLKYSSSILQMPSVISSGCVSLVEVIPQENNERSKVILCILENNERKQKKLILGGIHCCPYQSFLAY